VRGDANRGMESAAAIRAVHGYLVRQMSTQGCVPSSSLAEIR
jgi:hypothetical protein